jgi:hypothetical protein
MKNSRPALFVVLACLLGLSTWSYAGETAGDDANPAGAKEKPQSAKTNYCERVDRARAEAAEAVALFDKAAAEAKLQAVLRDRKIDEAVAKSRLETSLAQEEARKAEAEAHRVEATAHLLELNLRATKAQMELQHITKTMPYHFAAAEAEAKEKQIEAELKLAKAQEMQKKPENR